jgi:hypothetical protein
MARLRLQILKVFGVGIGVGVGVRVGFRLCLSCSCTGYTFPGHMLRIVFFGCSVSWWAMLHFVAGGIVMHDVYSWVKINPQKSTHQIDRICGACEYCALVSTFSVCLRGTPFIDDIE